MSPGRRGKHKQERALGLHDPLPRLALCEHDGKQSYFTREAAEAALARIRMEVAIKPDDRRTECRTYRCPKHRGTWHLTSLREAG